MKLLGVTFLPRNSWHRSPRDTQGWHTNGIPKEGTPKRCKNPQGISPHYVPGIPKKVARESVAQARTSP